MGVIIINPIVAADPDAPAAQLQPAELFYDPVGHADHRICAVSVLIAHQVAALMPPVSAKGARIAPVVLKGYKGARGVFVLQNREHLQILRQAGIDPLCFLVRQAPLRTAFGGSDFLPQPLIVRPGKPLGRNAAQVVAKGGHPDRQGLARLLIVFPRPGEHGRKAAPAKIHRPRQLIVHGPYPRLGRRRPFLPGRAFPAFGSGLLSAGRLRRQAA